MISRLAEAALHTGCIQNDHFDRPISEIASGDNHTHRNATNEVLHASSETHLYPQCLLTATDRSIHPKRIFIETLQRNARWHTLHSLLRMPASAGVDLPVPAEYVTHFPSPTHELLPLILPPHPL